MMPVTIIDGRLRDRISGIDRANSEQAFDAADDATDRSANHRANRAGVLVSDINAMRDAVRNALRLRRERRGEATGDHGGKQNTELHAAPTFCCDAATCSSNEGVCAASPWRRMAAARLTGRVTQKHRSDRPPLASPKRAVKLRLDAGVPAAYRKNGGGWQTRIDTDLRKATKLKVG